MKNRLVKGALLGVTALAVIAFLLSCAKERGTNPSPSAEYRLYAVGSHGDFPVYVFAIDDTSYCVIDTLSLGVVLQMEVSPDGHFLYVLRRTSEGGVYTEMVKVDVETESVIWSMPDVGFFVLSASGDTIIADSPTYPIVISTTNGSVITQLTVDMWGIARCLNRPWLAGAAGHPGDSSVIVYDYAGDSIVTRGVCRDKNGIAQIVWRTAIDPEGRYLYVTALRDQMHVIVIEISTWQTLAEFRMRDGFGEVGFGPNGSPVFLPDPGSIDFTWGRIYVVSPSDFKVLDTVQAVGPPCDEQPRYIGRLSVSPTGARAYGFPTNSNRPASVCILDSRTYEIIDWIAIPGTCDGGLDHAVLGVAPQ